jgi:hypothetical protein
LTPLTLTRFNFITSNTLVPLCVALALIGPLRTVAAVHPEADVAAYFDGKNVVGLADTPDRAFDRLTTAVFFSVGLTPVPNKCTVYGRNTCVARAASAGLGIAHLEHGAVVAGTLLSLGFWHL